MKKKPAKKAPEYDSERETRVLLEEMNQSIKIVAEQYGSIEQEIVGLKSTVAEHHGSIKQEIVELKSTVENRLTRVENRLTPIENRLNLIENRLSPIEAALLDTTSSVKKIEQKLDTITIDHEGRITKLEEKVHI